VKVVGEAASLMVQSVVLSGALTSALRQLWLEQAAAVGGETGELARCRDKNRRLTSENRLLKSRGAATSARTADPHPSATVGDRPAGAGTPPAVAGGQ
jgi:hypothetical protein